MMSDQTTAILKITNCIDCPKHEVVPDPDPIDWFNDDDVAVLCTLMDNDNPPHPLNAKFKHRPVTVACRPYAVRGESDVPHWCPLKDAEANGD
jgi:hypothetical protein